MTSSKKNFFFLLFIFLFTSIYAMDNKKSKTYPYYAVCTLTFIEHLKKNVIVTPFDLKCGSCEDVLERLIPISNHNKEIIADLTVFKNYTDCPKDSPDYVNNGFVIYRNIGRIEETVGALHFAVYSKDKK